MSAAGTEPAPAVSEPEAGLPTVATAPGGGPREPDGRDLDLAGHTHVFAEGERFLTVTDGAHKLVHAHRRNRDYLELFDLTANPEETRNLAGTADYAQVQRDLATTALTHLVGTALP